jgi:hypothetical protein
VNAQLDYRRAFGFADVGMNGVCAVGSEKIEAQEHSLFRNKLSLLPLDVKFQPNNHSYQSKTARLDFPEPSYLGQNDCPAKASYGIFVQMSHWVMWTHSYPR